MNINTYAVVFMSEIRASTFTTEFTSKDNNEIVFCRYFLLLFMQFWILAGFLYHPGSFFDIMNEELTLYSYYSLPYEYSGKFLPVNLTLTVLLIHFIHTYY